MEEKYIWEILIITFLAVIMTKVYDNLYDKANKYFSQLTNFGDFIVFIVIMGVWFFLGFLFLKWLFWLFKNELK